MKIDKAIADYTPLAGEMTNLRDRFRQAATVSSHKPFPEFEAEAKPFLDRLEKARSKALRRVKVKMAAAARIIILSYVSICSNILGISAPCRIATTCFEVWSSPLKSLGFVTVRATSHACP